jgi:hypothetical protein
MADTHNQRQETIWIPCDALGLKIRRLVRRNRNRCKLGSAVSGVVGAAGPAFWHRIEREHAIEPRLGKRLDLAGPSEYVKHIASARIFRSFGSLALPD